MTNLSDGQGIQTKAERLLARRWRLALIEREIATLESPANDHLSLSRIAIAEHLYSARPTIPFDVDPSMKIEKPLRMAIDPQEELVAEEYRLFYEWYTLERRFIESFRGTEL